VFSKAGGCEMNSPAAARPHSSTRRTHQLAFGVAQGTPPFHVVGTGRHGLAVHANRVSNAADPTEKIAVVDQSLVTAVAIEAQRLFEKLGRAVVVTGPAVLARCLM
jgi:hypothetical protein